MKTSSEFLAHAQGSSETRQKLTQAKSADELVKVASDTGHQTTKGDISNAMRGIASDELKKHGFPEWAIESVFRGDLVCW